MEQSALFGALRFFVPIGQDHHLVEILGISRQAPVGERGAGDILCIFGHGLRRQFFGAPQ